MICRNAYTDEFHQDSDLSYSLICVPFVNTSRSQSYLKMRGKYCFEFKWNECVDHSLKIDLASKHRKADLYCRSFGSLSCTITAAASCADIFARGFAPNVVLAREERDI